MSTVLLTQEKIVKWVSIFKYLQMTKDTSSNFTFFPRFLENLLTSFSFYFSAQHKWKFGTNCRLASCNSH